LWCGRSDEEGRNEACRRRAQALEANCQNGILAEIGDTRIFQLRQVGGVGRHFRAGVATRGLTSRCRTCGIDHSTDFLVVSGRECAESDFVRLHRHDRGKHACLNQTA
jgi:hypothetical protein